jgi:hypothetical protein
MLGLFSAKPKHPLADAKEARRIIEALETHKPAVIIDEVSIWLESLAGLDDIPASLRFRRIAELSAVAMPASRRLGREFLAAPQQEQKSWQLIIIFWDRLKEALQRCLDEVDANPKARNAFKPEMNALLAALLVAFHGHQRWIQFRYDALDGDQWAAMGKIYLDSQQEKFAENQVKPFGDAEGTTSIRGEYLKLLVFHASSMGNLSPHEISLAERFIAHFLPHFTLSIDPKGGTYWIDAGKPQPPMRLIHPPEASPGVSFIGLTQAVVAARELHGRITASQTSPSGIDLGGQYPVATLLAVLDHLSACWSPQPPTRSFQRHRVASPMVASNGFASLHAILSGTNLGQAQAESWQGEDVSQGGMSVRLPLSRNAQLQVGALVGCQPAGNGHWLIGVVRRFQRESETQGTAGIETLSKTPQGVTAIDSAMKTDLILLDPLRDDTSIRVLLKPCDWEDGPTMQLFIDGQPWRLHPDEKLEEGTDWLNARFIAESLDPDRR